MRRHEILLNGPGASGNEFDVAMMGALLNTVDEAVQGSLRLTIEGRSRSSGPVPKWLRDASNMNATVSGSCTLLVLRARRCTKSILTRSAKLACSRNLGSDDERLRHFRGCVKFDNKRRS